MADPGINEARIQNRIKRDNHIENLADDIADRRIVASSPAVPSFTVGASLIVTCELHWNVAFFAIRWPEGDGIPSFLDSRVRRGFESGREFEKCAV